MIEEETHNEACDLCGLPFGIENKCCPQHRMRLAETRVGQLEASLVDGTRRIRELSMMIRRLIRIMKNQEWVAKYPAGRYLRLMEQAESVLQKFGVVESVCREERTLCGEAICRVCGYKWVAVIAEGGEVSNLECCNCLQKSGELDSGGLTNGPNT